MNTASVRRLGLGITAAAVALVTCSLGAASASAADDVVASSTSNVVASSTTVNAAASRTKVIATASLPRGIVVTGHGGASVGLFTNGEQDRRKPRPGVAPATFTGLTPGRTYTVTLNEKVVGHVTALDRPAPASGLVVRTTDLPDAVNLTWKQKQSTATGGKALAYDIVAKDAKSPTTKPITMAVIGKHAATLKGLDPTALYTFTVTPRNTAGKGKPATATMTRSLFEITGKGVAVTPPPAPEAPTAPAPTTVPTLASQPAPASAPAPANPGPAPAPAPAPGPSTKTIYVCPAGYLDVAGLCQKTMAYTFDVQPYTYHPENIYGYGQVDWAYSWGYCTGSGKSGNWPNGDPYCQTAVYGNNAVVGTQQVKDATPTGYTDTGSAWSKKNPTPEGWLDDGTQWVKTVAKEAQVVPA